MTARTPKEVLARIKGADDVLGFSTDVLLCALPFEHARPFLVAEATEELWEQTREADIMAAARRYYDFALSKIRDHRGLSAERSTIKLREYAWLLGRDDVVAAMDAAPYPQYGAPKVGIFGVAVLGTMWPDDEPMLRMLAALPCRPDCSEGCGL